MCFRMNSVSCVFSATEIPLNLRHSRRVGEGWPPEDSGMPVPGTAESGALSAGVCTLAQKWTPIFGQPFKCNLPTHIAA